MSPPALGNLGARAKPAVAEIELRRELLDASAKRVSAVTAPGSASRARAYAAMRLAHAATASCAPLRSFSSQMRATSVQHTPERWTAVSLVRREVRAAVEHFAVRRQERGERPAALP